MCTFYFFDIFLSFGLFLLTDCEHLIRHMLIVDSNKRYSIAQIKQNKWMIQGEPYDDPVDLENHHEEKNGVCLYNEKVLQQIQQIGEDKGKVVEVFRFLLDYE